jgi:hypothetical protein
MLNLPFLRKLLLRMFSILNVPARLVKLLERLGPALLGTVVKYKGDLLDGHSAGLWEVEVGDDGDEKVEDNVHGVVLPLNLAKRDGVDKSGFRRVHRGQWMTYWLKALDRLLNVM